MSMRKLANKPMPSSVEALISVFCRLTAPGVLGYSNCCEVTEVIGFGPDKQPVNIFTIVALEERQEVPDKKPFFLNPNRIQSKKLKGWSFGISRYFAKQEELITEFRKIKGGNEWLLSGQQLSTGNLLPTRPLFVPPDATEDSPLNRVLKNNFWNGSYVFELFDSEKVQLLPLLENGNCLLQLSEAIQKFVPFRLASLADRLGNIVIQLPVSVVMARFSFIRDCGIKVICNWDSRIQPRSCRLISSMEYDGGIAGFGVMDATGGIAEAITGDSSRVNRAVLWDDDERFILAASGPVAALANINLQMQLKSPEPRIVVIPSPDGEPEIHRVQIMSLPSENIIGDPDPFEYRRWTDRRIYEGERKNLERDRIFVQYGLKPDKLAERKRALEDVQFLIKSHGQQGVWLWDPYLTYFDIMQTLFFCEYHGVDLRALACKRPKNTTFNDWQREQHLGFTTAGNNHYGLKLEFRLRHSGAGWGFHDRFLIFPRKNERALAWSIGTSINSLGTEHHILHRVDNGQIIADAFRELWKALDSDDYRVWRRP
jgi:hypothetical protein